MNTIKQFEQFTDIEIIEKVTGGELALFEILIRRYNPFLYKTGMSYGFIHADTQDLMQETFISAYLHLSQFENRSSFKTWITRIMLNNCFKKQHKLSTRVKMSNMNFINENQFTMNVTGEHNEVAETVINRELTHVIERSLAEIPIEYRLVFSLRHLSGMSTAETAEIMNITESNVKVRLNRAKSMLRKEIEKKYTPEDIFEFNLVYCDAIVNAVLTKLKTISENINTSNHGDN